jgi:hypothetical protein
MLSCQERGLAEVSTSEAACGKATLKRWHTVEENGSDYQQILGNLLLLPPTHTSGKSTLSKA